MQLKLLKIGIFRNRVSKYNQISCWQGLDIILVYHL